MSAGCKVLVVLNGKGGVGKTTTAVSVAAVLAGARRVLLMDADPQGSARWWAQRSQGGVGFEVCVCGSASQLQEVKGKGDYEVVVVDTPPALGAKGLQGVISLADYLVLPTPPAPMDLTALIETVRTVVRPTQVDHRVLLTRVDPRSLREALDAQNTLMEVGIPTFHAFVRSYKAHERAALEGVAITVLQGKYAKEARADYCRVVDEIERDWER